MAKQTALSTQLKDKKKRSRGVTMIMVACSLVFMIPMAGLAIDVGFLYVVKSKLQAAVDGAALAAARALSIGADLSSQTTSAQNNAVNWFNANFPSGNFFTSSTTMGTSNVTVANDPVNSQLRNVSVTATTRVGTIFMKWFNIPWTLVGASGTASRRTVVAMMVLDRSGSMCAIGGVLSVSSCKSGDANWASMPCSTMLSASKVFTGQFAGASDYIGLVSFSDSMYIHSAPVQTFQTALGYSNSSGSAVGAIDGISCAGYTNTAQGISAAYQLLAQRNLPGALNVVVLETDGLPNSLTMNLWDNANLSTGLTATSNCTDKNGKKRSSSPAGFATAAAIPAWTNGVSMTTAPFLTNSYGPFNTNIPAEMVGVFESDDTGTGTNMYILGNYWSNASSTPGSQSQSTASNYGAYSAAPGTAGCAFAASRTGYTNPPDINWFPATDVYSNAINPGTYPYKSVTTDGSGHLTQNGWTNFHNGVLNATDNAAYRARANTPNVNIGNVTFFVVGLGGNTSTGLLDDALMQRIANDPNGDTFNNPAAYTSCAQANYDCRTFAAPQPQGTYIFAPNQNNLAAAFLRISSQVLRLSK